ncbi:hypothetical protein SISSUDRAFT_786499 [Sistotremastrum suecicum HHB10207 ss-3]|uniref:Uncharacterized protein n=1 Tax=Sistotremastrum suecicum HHB10207 ss-3 TaxID=1314776 RepID=A0A166D064_9AGAM|nr:hypothetical protein SISSUDRAFT_786499 [Sistotremastrum suecicum HHB10207 ss-3]
MSFLSRNAPFLKNSKRIQLARFCFRRSACLRCSRASARRSSVSATSVGWMLCRFVVPLSDLVPDWHQRGLSTYWASKRLAWLRQLSDDVERPPPAGWSRVDVADFWEDFSSFCLLIISNQS